jgi:hypothetical protein
LISITIIDIDIRFHSIVGAVMRRGECTHSSEVHSCCRCHFFSVSEEGGKRREGGSLGSELWLGYGNAAGQGYLRAAHHKPSHNSRALLLPTAPRVMYLREMKKKRLLFIIITWRI